MTQTTRKAQLEAALADFFDAACRVSQELSIVQPFVALATKHAAVLRTLKTRLQQDGTND